MRIQDPEGRKHSEEEPQLFAIIASRRHTPQNSPRVVGGKWPKLTPPPPYWTRRLSPALVVGRRDPKCRLDIFATSSGVDRKAADVYQLVTTETNPLPPTSCFSSRGPT